MDSGISTLCTLASESIRSAVDGVVVFSPKLERQFSQPVRADIGREITACFTGVASGSPVLMAP